MTSYIFALAPAATLWFANGYSCGPVDEYALPINLLLAVSLGASGWSIGETDDVDAQAFFYAVLFMTGSGWAIASRYCTNSVLAIYSLLAVGAIVGYIVRCMKTNHVFAWVSASPSLFVASMYCFLRCVDLLRHKF